MHLVVTGEARERAPRGRKQVWEVFTGVVSEVGRYLFTLGVIDVLMPLYALYVSLGVIVYEF